MLSLVSVAVVVTWLGDQHVLHAQTEQVAPRPLFEIMPEEAPDLHDRSIEDWKRILPTPTVTEEDFQLGSASSLAGPGGVLGTSELSFDIYLGWMAEPPRIYAAFEVRDDVFVLDWEGDLPVHNEDHVGLGVDADRSGGRFQGYEEEDCGGSFEEAVEREDWYCIAPVYYTNRQAQMWTALLPEGLDAHLWGFRPWLADTPWSEIGGAVAKDGAGAVVEFMVTPFDVCDFRGPEHSTVARLAAGQTIGLEVFLIDFDVDGEDANESDGRLYHIKGPYSHVASDDYPPFILFPAPARPTAIGTESWGRVKKKRFR